ncbi:MAG: Rrf2 family transcriptional regulator [Armatimonadota bacterium]|nr:Rrf2 family transcriptional regulator [Armatimonadota bacterium]MCX7777547.1 Rrf2 family transcriptional regulator [Armatimonadota bacterium]MDW8025556.1 Rrf2 family transcriptional regulator [Armatimonadota bacterium]
MRFSTKARYGLRFLIDLAVSYKDSPVRLRDIALREKISKKYLEHIVSVLVANGFVRAVRGSKGGFVLAKPMEQIVVLDVIEALEGKLSVVECILLPEVCERSPDCVARMLWTKVNEAIRQTLRGVTLKDLYNEAVRCERKRKR